MLPNQLCIYGSGHHAEHFCETILNLDQWFKRKCCLRHISYLELPGPLFQFSGIICAIMVKCITRINSEKFSQECSSIMMHTTKIAEMSLKDISSSSSRYRSEIQNWNVTLTRVRLGQVGHLSRVCTVKGSNFYS